MTDVPMSGDPRPAPLYIRLPSLAGPAGWNLFVALIALATFLPLVVLPLKVEFGRDINMLFVAGSLLFFVGGPVHVATTALFYTDGSMRRHFGTNKPRYVFVPLALIAGGALAFATLPESYLRYILLYLFMWNTWHIQRQNFGILSFLASATDRVPITRFEKLALNVAVVAGMLAYIKVGSLNAQTLLAPFTDLIWGAGWMIYATVPFLIVAALMEEPRIRQNKARVFVLVLFCLFFVPSFVFTDPLAAVASYAMAHGLQYIVFMAYVSASRPRPVLALAMLAGFALFGGYVLNLLFAEGHSGWLRMLNGVAVGVTMAHFVIDAGVWKLRYPFQRAYMKAVFPFVFERRATS